MIPYTEEHELGAIAGKPLIPFEEKLYHKDCGGEIAFNGYAYNNAVEALYEHKCKICQSKFNIKNQKFPRIIHKELK